MAVTVRVLMQMPVLIYFDTLHLRPRGARWQCGAQIHEFLVRIKPTVHVVGFKT